MSGQGPIDLGPLLRDPNFVVSVASAPDPAEAEHRRMRATQDALHRRRIFWAVFGVLMAMMVIAISIIVLSDNSANRGWARDVVTAIVGLIAGYAGGVVSMRSE